MSRWGMLPEVIVVKRLSVVIGFVAAAATLASASALAWHGGARVWVGPGYYPYPYPYYYAPMPYYAPPPVIVVPGQPDTYVEKSAADNQPGANGSIWYYCDKAGAYYPYVKSCPQGWREVPAKPASN